MKQKRIILFCFALILWLGTTATSSFVLASEKPVGGQVNVNGKISFYEETTQSSSSVSTEPSTVMPSQTNWKFLPSTGEQIRGYCLVGGSLFLLILLLLFLRKRRKEKEQ